MFLAYWPVLGLVVGLVLAAVFTVLLLAGRVCRARHECLPERDISTYLPESVRSRHLSSLDVLTYPHVMSSASAICM